MVDVLSARVTTAPPVGAGSESVTAQLMGVPPVTTVGETDIPIRTGAGLNVTEADLVTLPRVAVTVSGVAEVTDALDTLKLICRVPASTVTESGVIRLTELSVMPIVVFAVANAVVETVP